MLRRPNQEVLFMNTVEEANWRTKSNYVRRQLKDIAVISEQINSRRQYLQRESATETDKARWIEEIQILKDQLELKVFRVNERIKELKADVVKVPANEINVYANFMAKYCLVKVA